MHWKEHQAHGRAIGMSQWEVSQAVPRAGEFAREVKGSPVPAGRTLMSTILRDNRIQRAINEV
jgi:hypothetical protein